MNLCKAKCDLTDKYFRLLKDAKENGIYEETIQTIFLHRVKPEGLHSTFLDNKTAIRVTSRDKIRKAINKWTLFRAYMFYVIFVLGFLTATLIFHYRRPIKYLIGIETWHCFVENNAIASEVTRPLLNCSICSSLQTVPIEYSISAEVFNWKYAHASVPVLIKNATTSWLAMKTFSYDFFKTLYMQTDGALDSVEEECQFFHLNTDFKNLTEVFNMSDTRAHFTDGEKPWYIGWSNCHKKVKKELRKHYERPYFLPNDSESSTIDWIFMGGPGPGAFLHLDYVQRPSWQAQISGKKTWTLISSPECESVCKPLNVTVHKGDIFVIDTNVWYHSTFIHPGEISITIGSEYD